MDSPSESTPTKKRRTLTNGDKMRLAECVREFNLPQQYPSTMKQASKSGINVDLTALNLPGNAGVLSNAKKALPYNLQKLRILSPRGRDLGEFNVKVRSDDPSKGSTIMLTKSVNQPKPSPSVLSTRTLPRILRQGTGIVPKSKLTEVVDCRSVFSRNNTGASRQSTTLINRQFSGQSTEGKTEKQTCNSFNAVMAPSTSGVSSKYSICQTDSSQRYVVQNGTGDTDCNSAKVQEAAAKNCSRVAPSTDVPTLYKKIESLCPANCKSLVINSNDGSTKSLFTKIGKGQFLATIKNTESGKKVITSLRSLSDVVRKSSRTGDSSIRDFDDDGVACDGDGSLEIKLDVIPRGQAAEVRTRNVMTIIPSNEALLLNQKAVLAQKSASQSVASVDHGAAGSDTPSQGSKAKSRNDHVVIIDSAVRCIPQPHQLADIIGANAQSNVQNLPRKSMSTRFNIIKKTMNSVRDNELRMLALRALADCGIGIERYVPVCPPSDHRAVHDAQVQTCVFGLLDPKYFVLINKDLNDIHRVNQITLHDVPGDQNPLADDRHSNNVASREAPNVDKQEINFDIDNFVEEFLKDELNTFNKMKETLSVTRERCNSIYTSLQRDFENAKRYDQNGMLNIHNAVINDNVELVCRQLVVLKNSGQSVDMLTEDGETSLELAIKYDACSEIVERLLNAGAQPVLPKSLRDSAVIIASKHSSSLLPMLVDRVSDSKLLDQIDSEGFAAIHYCSIYGNLQGVRSLISSGATIDLKDWKSGRTALFHAIDNSHKSVMQALLKAGAVATIANYAGQGWRGGVPRRGNRIRRKEKNEPRDGEGRRKREGEEGQGERTYARERRKRDARLGFRASDRRSEVPRIEGGAIVSEPGYEVIVSIADVRTPLPPRHRRHRSRRVLTAMERA